MHVGPLSKGLLPIRPVASGMRGILKVSDQSASCTGTMLRRFLACAVVAVASWLPAMAMGAPTAQASQTDCLSSGYACTPGYDATNTEGTWAWSHYGGTYALN